MTTDRLSHAHRVQSDTTDASEMVAPTQADCIAEAADLLALAIAEQAELVATDGVAAAARAAGCRSDAEIAAWGARFFPGVPVEFRRAS